MDHLDTSRSASLKLMFVAQRTHGTRLPPCARLHLDFPPVLEGSMLEPKPARAGLLRV